MGGDHYSSSFSSLRDRHYGKAHNECEKLILDNCPKLRPEQVLPNPAEQAILGKTLRRRLDGIDGELTSIEAKLANLTVRISEAPSKEIAGRLFEEMTRLEGRKVELNTSRTATTQELTMVENDADSFKAWQGNLKSLKEALKVDNPELRMTLQSHLREFIERIEIFAHGHQSTHHRVARNAGAILKRTRDGIVELNGEPPSRDEGDDFEEAQLAIASEFYPEMLKDRIFVEFINQIARRRQTREGRFYRVRFKTGLSIDLVPTGSLASGRILDASRNEWRYVSPNIEQLWNEFSGKNLPTTRKKR